MNKLFLIALYLITCTVSAVEIHKISSKDIIGEWVCAIKYPDLHIESLDRIEYTEKGETFGWGMLSFNKNMLNYETKHSGHWQLKDDVLSEVSTNYQMIKVHSEQTNKRLNNDAEFNILEQRLYKNLSKEANSGTSIDLKIHKVEGNIMLFTQIMGKEGRYPGACKKEEQKAKHKE